MMMTSTILLATALAAGAEKMRTYVNEGLIAGAVMTTTADDATACVGWARLCPDQTPMRENTLFDVASLTKPVTALLLAVLASEGKVDVDAPFVKYLPEDAVGPDSAITVRDLAMHRSGFVTKNHAFDDPTDETVFRRRVLAHKPQFGCPNRFLYSCHNYILLGMIAERVGGKRLDVLAKEKVFGPLGMNDTCWGPLKDDGRPMRSAYRRIEPGRIVDYIAGHCPCPIGNAGLFTTAGDMKKLLADLLARKTFAPSVYALVFDAQTCADGTKRSFGWDMSDEDRPAGVSAKAIWHTGSTGQTILADPERNLGVVVLTSRWARDDMAGHDAAILARRKVVETILSR